MRSFKSKQMGQRSLCEHQCNIIQKYNRNSKILYKPTKEITGRKTTKLCVLKDRKGEIITEEKNIKERWKEYTEELYKKNATIKGIFTTTFVQEPAITKAEVANAIKEISSGKSPEINEIPAELIKVTGKEGT